MNKRKAPVDEEEEEEEVISDRCVIDQCGRGCRQTYKHVVNTKYYDSAVSTHPTSPSTFASSTAPRV